MSAEIEIIQRQPESLRDQVERLVQRRLREIMAREDLSTLAPFFESKKSSDELRRLQTAQDWHKFRVYYETFGCLVCSGREQPHNAVGMCRNCHRRTVERLKKIRKRLNEASKDAEHFLDSLDRGRVARQALGLPAELASVPPKPKIGRPKMGPKILPGLPGERVRKLREIAGMSQADLCRAAHVDRKTIISLERGDHLPLPAHCDAVRKVLVEAFVRALWP